MSKYVMAIDQGTTSSRCIIFNAYGEIITCAQEEITQIYPKAGWVEHDANEIWKVQLNVVREALLNGNIAALDIAAIGITNQRETVVVWDKRTGLPVCNAIVWQCRRSAAYCDELKNEGYDIKINEKTGLILDAYFSATKVKWILDNTPGAREDAENGNLLFGTIDTWLIWNLTGGKVHATDYSNASRTMLYNIYDLEWDKELLTKFNIPESMLPEVRPSSGLFGYTTESFFGVEVPITGDAGDQQAALFGQASFEEGCAKNTYGTGCFLLMNTGCKPVKSSKGLLTTIAWGFNNKIEYALEGSIFVAGAAVQWLRDEMKLISNASETETLALSVEDTNGVYMVPAFVGLGAPYWDPYARGTIVGITRGVRREHIVRATLEAIAYQTYDILKAMELDSGILLKELKVDGGASANDFLLQFQSNILGVDVIRPQTIETTALGAAYLAGLAVGFWKNVDEVKGNWKVSKRFISDSDDETRVGLLKGWHEAVNRSMGWIK